MPRIPRLTSDLSAAAIVHLRDSDAVMRTLIDEIGPFKLKPRRSRFVVLVRAIISQQISTKAAESIFRRLLTIAGPEGITPESIARLTPAKYRKAGISPQKQGYLRDLAVRTRDSVVRLDRIGSMSDEQVIAELIQVKGIGVWTAQMFLIFTLGRPDVFPHEDLGVRTAIKRAYGLPELPDKNTSHAIAASWRPYATVASWYCWRSLELPAEFFVTAATGLKSVARPAR